jgi:acetylornithine deacetylase
MESYREALISLASDLVRIPTINFPPDGDEAPGQERLRACYEALGLKIDQFSPADLPEYPSHPEFLPRNLKGRENLVGTWKGTGNGKSVVITGHMDVVPIEPLPWTVTQPFEPKILDGKLYGRGSADMKGGLAAAAIAVRMLKDEGFVPRGDVILESVVDEEYAGANGTIASRLRGHNADFAIVPEASGLSICPACVGGMVFKLTMRGVAGMPYTGEEIPNLAYDLGDLLNLIRDFSAYRIETAPKPPLWAGTVQGAQVVVTKVRAGEAYESGQLSAPIEAWVELVMQSYPGESAEKLEKELKDFMSARFRDPMALKIEPQYHYCRPAATDPEHPGVKALALALTPYTSPSVCGAMFSCDMFVLTELGGIPSVIFGPVGGRLHGPDEWVDVESLLTCARVMADFIRKWCA